MNLNDVMHQDLEKILEAPAVPILHGKKALITTHHLVLIIIRIRDAGIALAEDMEKACEKFEKRVVKP